MKSIREFARFPKNQKIRRHDMVTTEDIVDEINDIKDRMRSLLHDMESISERLDDIEGKIEGDETNQHQSKA